MTNEIVSFQMEPKTLEEAMKFAEIIAKSDLVPKDYKGNPGNVLIAIQWGQEIGLKPLQALQNIACINGRPSLWGDAVLSLVRGSGLLEDFREDFDANIPSATCSAKRKGQPTPIIRTFSKQDAEKAGLWTKAGSWAQYPKRMLQMRARAFALRDGFADVLKGMAIAEEQQDVIDVQAEPLPAPPAPPKRLSQKDDVDPIADWEKALAGAESLDALHSAWTRLTVKGGLYETLTKDEQNRLTVAKDSRKFKLSEPKADAAA